MKLQKLGTFDFEDTSFEVFVDFIRAYAEVNIVVTWPALQANGVDKNTPVTISLIDVTCEKALRELLRAVPNTGAPLDYAIDEGVVRISTKDDLSCNVVTQVYDVAELLADGDPQGYQADTAALLTLITTHVDSVSWQTNGGTIGAVQEFNGLLVVTQTPNNHADIGKLLENVRQVKASRPPTYRQQAARTGAAIRLVGEMKDTAFEPAVVGLIAVAGLRDDVARDPKAVIEDLEALLAKTNSLGLRNAIRLTLRDLYKQTGNQEKLLQHLRAMLEENDAAAAKVPPVPFRISAWPTSRPGDK